MAIYVIDEMMGRGKTSAMINWINRSGENERYIFITPYLTEVERIKSSCVGRDFEDPKAEGGKLNNIKPLLAAKRNIVTTHELFKRFDPEVIGLILDGGYTLIVDEVIDAIDKFDASPYDCRVIMSNYVSVEDDGRLVWDAIEYSGKFDEYKAAISEGNVYSYNNSNLISLIPSEFFHVFKDVYVMTYMFGDQLLRCYFDLMGLGYQRLHVIGNSRETYTLTEIEVCVAPMDFTNLIHIDMDRKLNRVGDGWYALSKGWYRRNYESPLMKELKNDTYNYFHNRTGSPADLNLWTTFGACDEGTSNPKDFRKQLSGKGYTRGFLACNARGTNEFKDRTTAAYLVNRFPDTGVHNFLYARGIEQDADQYALSEMLQWIWRTAIRDGKEIYLYIPSERMRNLLIQWMDDVKNGKE